jgi:hypothetical protein
MAGDVNNAAVWADADVYIADSLATASPAGGAAFGAGWDLVGLLNGDDGFAESYGFDSNDHYAWGGVLVATTRKNFKVTKSFTALEDNQTVMGLVYDASGVTFTGSDYSGDLAIPDLSRKFRIAFETASGGEIKRLISKNYAQVDKVGDSKEGESNLASRQFTVCIYPDSNGVLWETYKGAAS